jgi:hypothetical protein
VWCPGAAPSQALPAFSAPSARARDAPGSRGRAPPEAGFLVGVRDLADLSQEAETMLARVLVDPQTGRRVRPPRKTARNPMIYLRERAFERDDAFLVERLVASFRSVTRPVGSFGSPACCRNFAAISEISSGA